MWTANWHILKAAFNWFWCYRLHPTGFLRFEAEILKMLGAWNLWGFCQFWCHHAIDIGKRSRLTVFRGKTRPWCLMVGQSSIRGPADQSAKFWNFKITLGPVVVTRNNIWGQIKGQNWHKSDLYSVNEADDGSFLASAWIMTWAGDLQSLMAHGDTPMADCPHRATQYAQKLIRSHFNTLIAGESVQLRRLRGKQRI